MKNTKLFHGILVAVVISLFHATPLLAAIPEQVNYQGRLVGSTDNPVPDGEYAITFSIYDSIQSTQPIWSEIQMPITVNNGLFSTMLPSDKGSPFPEDLFGKGRYLGISVEKDPEMTPRQPLASTPFSFLAENSDKIAGQTLGELDTRYVNTGEEEIINSSMIMDGSVTGADLSETYLSAGNLQSNQPFQYSNDDFWSNEHSSTTVLATGEHTEVVPEGKRLVIQHISYSMKSDGMLNEPMCEAKVMNDTAQIVAHPLVMTISTYRDARLARVSTPITLYADPGMYVGVSCWVRVEDDVNESFGVTGYFIDLE